MSAASPPKISRTMPARRAFLAGLLDGSFVETNPHFRRIPAQRVALLREIALRWEQRLPQGAVPLLRATEACAGHGVCTAVCPTGALSGFEDRGQTGTEFDAAACFACGACVVTCPEQALSLERADSVPAASGRITRHALRTCARCEDEFPACGEERLCPACRKDVALFTTGFQTWSVET